MAGMILDIRLVNTSKGEVRLRIDGELVGDFHCPACVFNFLAERAESVAEAKRLADEMLGCLSGEEQLS